METMSNITSNLDNSTPPADMMTIQINLLSRHLSKSIPDDFNRKLDYRFELNLTKVNIGLELVEDPPPSFIDWEVPSPNPVSGSMNSQ